MRATAEEPAVSGWAVTTPKYRCKVHGEIDTVIMWRPPGEPARDYCASCWTDWLEAQGWRVERIEK